MRVIVTIQHPAHVHFFKHAIAELEADGNDVYVFARENEVVRDLLESYDIDHEILAGESDSLFSLARVQATYEARLLARARKIKPDVITAIGGPAATHVAKLVGAKSVVFYDTEHATLIKMLAYPFADIICTPECYDGDIGSKKVEYPGYHELAYLHPDRFEPDPTVLEEAGLEPDDTFVVMRLSSWDSSHDMGQGGFNDPIEAVERLEDAGATVLITSEVPLPDELEANRMTTSPDQIHDLLAYADCFIGEGATTAAEAAILGTPAVYVNSLSLGYMQELEDEYGLVFNFNDEGRHARSLEKAVSIIENRDEETWRRRRDRLLADRVDVTDVIVRELETVLTTDSDRSTVAANAD
ncbi:hypothetical protein C491_08093 [Natronococcus amylolyticus DSM 10524]|uniref:DUF354 domain-containing protein n=1 Tax=Natronococcus amylolyticus DSM 10524 TaxID=1227497 RepID=L9XB67_9EURY|nr:DUF354 domain-containing protein [Natronococcus amylolyticus]ELY58882.1 hypothetical protein C491_08093 [Natronococcus amylolyticus DSM 10524]